jgi:CPA2 family monovalent cation:H+ antiporter-2
MSELTFLKDLAMLMAVAGMVSVIFSCLRWPKVIGYIFAGVLMSRHTWGGAFLVDESSVMILGQLGVVFLMFTMGLGFSVSEIKKIGSVALPVALVDVAIMMWIGYSVGHNIFHWAAIPSIFLGAAICDSATTLLAKTISEMKWINRPFVRYAIGTSICEDILCVGVIALVTGAAGGAEMSFLSVSKSIGAIAIFFTAVFVTGILVFPRLLSFAAKKGDSEVLLLTLLGFCFLVTYVAYVLNFSLALGAFLTGILAANCGIRSRISKLVDPLRSMFSAVFFVSVGLLVDPMACWNNISAILIISAVVMAGKCLNCTFGTLLCGTDLRTSVQTGFSLAQIGEFAYMIALLYVALVKDTNSPMYQIVVGVSLLTTILNVPMIKISGKVADLIERKCPPKILNALNQYTSFLSRYKMSGSSGLHQRVRSKIVGLAVSAVLIFSAAFAVSLLNSRDWSNFSVFFNTHKRLFFFIALNLSAACVVAVVVRLAKALADDVCEALLLRKGSESKRILALRHVVRFVILLLICALFLIELLLVNAPLLPEGPVIRAILALVFLVVMILGWRIFSKAGKKATKDFLDVISGVEDVAQNEQDDISLVIPGDSVFTLTVGSESPAIGLSVAALNIRAKTGATIFSVKRDGVEIRNIGPEFEFSLGDEVMAVGNHGQISALKDLLGVTK